jgi:hypothetical protein
MVGAGFSLRGFSKNHKSLRKLKLAATKKTKNYLSGRRKTFSLRKNHAT